MFLPIKIKKNLKNIFICYPNKKRTSKTLNLIQKIKSTSQISTHLYINKININNPIPLIW